MGCTNIRVASFFIEKALEFPDGVEILGIERSTHDDRVYVFTVAGDSVPNAPECAAVYRKHPPLTFEPVKS